MELSSAKSAVLLYTLCVCFVCLKTPKKIFFWLTDKTPKLIVLRNEAKWAQIFIWKRSIELSPIVLVFLFSCFFFDAASLELQSKNMKKNINTTYVQHLQHKSSENIPKCLRHILYLCFHVYVCDKGEGKGVGFWVKKLFFFCILFRRIHKIVIKVLQLYLKEASKQALYLPLDFDLNKFSGVTINISDTINTIWNDVWVFFLFLGCFHLCVAVSDVILCFLGFFLFLQPQC